MYTSIYTHACAQTFSLSKQQIHNCREIPQCEAARVLQTQCSKVENDEGRISACLFCSQVAFYSSFLVNVILIIKKSSARVEVELEACHRL